MKLKCGMKLKKIKIKIKTEICTSYANQKHNFEKLWPEMLKHDLLTNGATSVVRNKLAFMDVLP